MKRKRFLKLSMSQGVSKRVAIFAANWALGNHGNYFKAWNSLGGIISGRFEMYVK